MRSKTARHPVSPSRGSSAAPLPARERFLRADRYRVEREWNRYEGSAQRDLYRVLRERFLGRHVQPSPWAIDIGAGPGRFTGRLGSDIGHVVALDLSATALRYLAERWAGRAAGPVPERVRGDGARPPFRAGSFGVVALLGNTLGFAEDRADRVLAASLSLVAPSGRIVLEIAPGAGEISCYFARLPASSLGRLLRAPVPLLVQRVQREGFATMADRRKSPGSFRRIDVDAITAALSTSGFAVREAMAVAPALGGKPERLEAVHGDAKAWDHLLELEETIGRSPDRFPRAAAVLVAAERTTSEHTIN